MEAAHILELMDSCWFERRIFRNKDEFPSLAAQKKDESGEKSTVQNLQIRSYSDRCIAVDFEAADSPRSVITKPKLQTILSGEETVEFCLAVGERREKPRIKKLQSSRRRERGRNGMSRSLSALEFEELKGFMDLGFVFSEEETNPDLVSIVPALQKLRKMAAAGGGGGDGKGEEEVENSKKGGICRRPYLSEAWGDLSIMKKGEGNILMNLRIPSVRNEIDMKDHLKVWAHVVASTVR